MPSADDITSRSTPDTQDMAEDPPEADLEETLGTLNVDEDVRPELDMVARATEAEQVRRQVSIMRFSEPSPAKNQAG